MWRKTAEKCRRELLGSKLQTLCGHVERIEAKDVPVVQVIAARLVDHSQMLGRLAVASRNFH